MRRQKLTAKQQRFVDFYNGNAVEACRQAGYGHPESASRTLVQNHTLMQLIHDREQKRNNPKIATREERQAFWTSVYRGEETQDVVIGSGDDAEIHKVPPKMIDRLKASELLGRSECDFIEKHEHTGKDGENLFAGITINLVDATNGKDKDPNA